MFDGVEDDVDIRTFSYQGDVMKGVVVHGDLDLSDVHRIESYLELADYFPVRPLTDGPLTDGRTVIAGSEHLVGYVGDYSGDVDIEF